MNFNTKESIQETIQTKLAQIEQSENIKILHAVESGSRAWGFESEDSDYDVRFIYIRPIEQYLSLKEKKDFIDWELNEVLDINGWDITKVLKHFYKSNATLFEWSNSPIVYKTSETWKEIKKISEEYFSIKPCMYHYYGTAKKNYLENLTTEMVKYKKYFYVLRPILACKWIEERKSPATVCFQDLLDEMLEKEMRPCIDLLLEQKRKMKESQTAPRVDVVNEYIEQKLVHYDQVLRTMPEDAKKSYDQLDALFLKLLGHRQIGNKISKIVRTIRIALNLCGKSNPFDIHISVA